MSVANIIKMNQVVLFSWVTCPFCTRAIDILKPIAKDMKVYQVDEMSNGEDLRKQILETYHHETVPAIFINAKFVGGCSELQKLQASGELDKLLGPSA